MPNRDKLAGPVRRLAAGGKRIRTIGPIPLLRKGLPGIAEPERPAGPRIELRSSRETAMPAGAISAAVPFTAGPMVRICFPPAGSLVRTRLPRTQFFDDFQLRSVLRLALLPARPEVRFARDSPVEGDGLEPSVPRP